MLHATTVTSVQRSDLGASELLSRRRLSLLQHGCKTVHIVSSTTVACDPTQERMQGGHYGELPLFVMVCFVIARAVGNWIASGR